MNISLNFSSQNLKSLQSFLDSFEIQKTNSKYELGRWKILESTAVLYSSGKLLIQGKNVEHVKELILSKIPLDDLLVLGIDETGRGENFGIMVVAGVLGKSKDLLELRDSKKTKDIEPKKKLVDKQAIHTYVKIFTPAEIDRARTSGINLNQLEAQAMDEIIAQAQKTSLEFKIKIDGNPLPVESKNVQFIVKGDDKEPVIAAASVLAKFTRDISSNKEKRKTWKNS